MLHEGRATHTTTGFGLGDFAQLSAPVSVLSTLEVAGLSYVS